MIKISVFGHSPDAFSDAKSLAYDIDNAIAVIKRQHGQEKDFIFLLNCDPGASQWFCNELMEQDIAYEIFLSTSPDEAYKHWSEEQQERFVWQLGKARAIHVCGMDNSLESRIKRDEQIIDESQCVIFFWGGKHQGATYRALEYALKKNKIVYNGMNHLSLMDKSALKVGERF